MTQENIFPVIYCKKCGPFHQYISYKWSKPDYDLLEIQILYGTPYGLEIIDVTIIVGNERKEYEVEYFCGLCFSPAQIVKPEFADRIISETLEDQFLSIHKDEIS